MRPLWFIAELALLNANFALQIWLIQFGHIFTFGWYQANATNT